MAGCYQYREKEATKNNAAEIYAQGENDNQQ